MYELRPEKERDYDFAFDLFCQVNEDQRKKFWQGQDDAFEAHFRKHYFLPEITQIIMYDDIDIGILQLVKIVEQMYIQELMILPEYQRRGIGTRVIKDVMHMAFEQELSVGVSIKKINPAKHLFDRLGFIMVDETRTHYTMEIEKFQPKIEPPKKKLFNWW